MKPVVFVLLVTVALAQAERNWDKIFPRHLENPPHLPLPNGIPSPRITGGSEAARNSIKHQAALLLPIQGGTAFCGGSLISARTILTAAHCVEGLEGPVEIILGAHYVRQAEATQVVIRSSNVVIHPQWSSTTLVNDIALIILPNAVAFTDAIQPISLPADDTHTYDGSNGIVSGWGLASDSAQTISDVLRFVEVPIISNTLCNIAYFGQISSTNICSSGSGGKSTCSGDSGGAITVDGVQVGIVSFGIALGCEIGWPSAYTRVSKYLSFVNANKV